jgi:hypothetical protein
MLSRSIHYLDGDVLLTELAATVMLTLGRDPKLTETDTHHHALRNLEVFPENFALSSIFPFLKEHGVKVPIKSIREPFQIQAGWNKVG